jgi:hypothetical protein
MIWEARTVGEAVRRSFRRAARRTGEMKRTPPSPDKLPAFFYRLPVRMQRCYLRSNTIDRFEFAPIPSAAAAIAELIRVLESGDVPATARAAAAAAAEVCRCAQVAPVRIDVRGVRPRNTRGELHGLFYPYDPRQRTLPHIVLWMRTAERHQVVKPRTFVRTLMHELVHYFDYAVLRLDDSFHTMGFFKRESYLVRALMPPETEVAPPTGSDASRGGRVPR